MSSTNRDRDRKMRAFFTDHLVPAANASRALGRSFFPTGPAGSQPSYYVQRSDESSYVFELEGDASAQLVQLWSNTPELHALIAPLLKLSSTLAVREEISADVSPFVYAMF